MWGAAPRSRPLAAVAATAFVALTCARSTPAGPGHVWAVEVDRSLAAQLDAGQLAHLRAAGVDALVPARLDTAQVAALRTRATRAGIRLLRPARIVRVAGPAAVRAPSVRGAVVVVPLSAAAFPKLTGAWAEAVRRADAGAFALAVSPRGAGRLRALKSYLGVLAARDG